MTENGARRVRHLDLVEDDVLGLRLLRPRSADVLISEREFERDEFLPYWAELWPSAVALAGEVERRELVGAHVLELGCGLALPSLIAARGGARVLATDWAEDAVALLAENAARNGVALEAARVDWRQPAPLLERAPFDLVLAADVLYERRHVEPLLDVLPGLGSETLLADPGRPFTRGFLERATSRLHVKQLGERLYSLSSVD